MFSRYCFLLFFTLTSFSTFAQLCQGSLGDPLINITFGSGNNPGPPLAAAATGYQYVANDCPNDGFYTVRGNTTSCFPNAGVGTWHSVSSDHTGNSGGYFMLVNASIQPSAFYVDTVRGLCGNSTYEFAAWIMNVILPSSCNGNTNQPNLTFTIERTNGTVLQTYNSGNIPPTTSQQWKQYGFFFTTPAAGADIVLRIVNNAAGGCGNDLILDDITFRPCGPQITPSINGLSTIAPSICQGTAKTFTFSSTVSAGFTNPTFQWQQNFNNAAWTDIPGANSTTYTLPFLGTNPVGVYNYRLTVAEAGNLGSAQCRISSVTLSVTVTAPPVATASNNGPVCAGKDITLTATGGTTYAWTGPGGYNANTGSAIIPSITTSQAGNYTVSATNAVGCTATASTTVVVNPVPVATVAFADTAVCQGGRVQLLASGSGTFLWSPAAGLSATNIANPFASPTADSRYKVLLTNTTGCTDSAFINVKVYEKAIANAGPDKFIVGGGNITLSASIAGPYNSFTWTPTSDLNTPQSLTPTASPAIDTRYILTAFSKNNCGISTDTMFVKLFNGIYIPNAFTPNSDGQNDTWNIAALDAYPEFELFVFNRYGEVVFKNSKLRKPWDGSYKSAELSTGVYVYVLKLNVANQVLKGTVMIIR